MSEHLVAIGACFLIGMAVTSFSFLLAMWMNKQLEKEQERNQ